MFEDVVCWIQVNSNTADTLGVPKLTQFVQCTEGFVLSTIASPYLAVSMASKTGRVGRFVVLSFVVSKFICTLNSTRLREADETVKKTLSCWQGCCSCLRFDYPDKSTLTNPSNTGTSWRLNTVISHCSGWNWPRYWQKPGDGCRAFHAFLRTMTTETWASTRPSLTWPSLGYFDSRNSRWSQIVYG